MKSTAILFADLDKVIIGILRALFIAVLLVLPRHVDLTWPFYIGLVAASGLMVYRQNTDQDRSRDGCFKAFQHNHWVGLTVFLGILATFGF